MKKRNGIVDLMKFVFSIIIVLFHYGCFHPKEVGSVFMHCGYIGVEFYFIVSGYLLMKKANISECSENVFKDNLTMIKNRYIRFFPKLFLAVIIANIYIHYTQGSTLNIVVHDALYSLSDLFLLQMLGFSGFWATGVSWYLSSLLIITFVIYPILHKYKEKFVYYIAPIVVLFIYGAIAQNNITINCITERYGFLQGGILRGLAGILLGCISYFIAKNIKENINLYNKHVLFVLEMLGYILSIVFVVFYKRWDEMDFIIVFLLFISITISFSSQSLSATIFKNKIFNFLGEFSFCIYLNHYYVASNIDYFLGETSKVLAFVVYGCTVAVLSLVNYYLGERLKTILSRKSVARKNDEKIYYL